MDDSRLFNLARPLLMMLSLLTRNLDARAEQCAADVAELAVRLGLAADETEKATVAAWLHDLGMAMLPWIPFAEADALTASERRQMQGHPTLAAEVVVELRRIEPAFEQIAAAIRHHHERWDGQGYPDGLAGEEIPIAARMIAVSDAYSAMTSERP
jgi:HD-GYP domain-containing protein (c-di-GMP phosphodiesterase class II)